MYAVAKERTKEIGIKLAIGARRRVIVQQFLLETCSSSARGRSGDSSPPSTSSTSIRLAPVNYDSFGIEAYLLRPVFSLQIFLAYMTHPGRARLSLGNLSGLARFPVESDRIAPL